MEIDSSVHFTVNQFSIDITCKSLFTYLANHYSIKFESTLGSGQKLVVSAYVSLLLVIGDGVHLIIILIAATTTCSFVKTAYS